MEAWKFVIWGAGDRGKLITEFLGESQIAAYIDSDKAKQGKAWHNRPVISFSEYKVKYNEYFVIVTPVDEEPILSELESNHITWYFRMSHLPSEMQGYGDTNFFDKLPMSQAETGNNIILGTTLYSCLLYRKLMDAGNGNVYLFSVDTGELEKQIEKHLHCRFTSRINYEKDNILLTTPEYNGEELYYRRNVTDLFDLSEKLPQYYNPDMEAFRNIHSKKRCFIIATGPSLREEDLKVLAENKEICFGVNRIFHVDEKLWKPQYYIFADRAGMRQYWNEIAAYDVEEKFLGDSYWEDTSWKGNVHRMHVVTGHSFPIMPEFSEKLERKVYAYGTVTYMAIQLAVYMGVSAIYWGSCAWGKVLISFPLYLSMVHKKPTCFSTIILYAVTFLKVFISSNNYFFKDQREDRYNHYVDRMVLAYRRAGEYARAHGVEIFNASRGGNLEEFERVCFDEIHMRR